MPRPPTEKEQAYQNRLIDTHTGKMALFLGITFGMLVVLDNMLPGTGVLLAISILLVYLYKSMAVEWIAQFFRWLEGLVK